jgi:gliding motility-associated-like protein
VDVTWICNGDGGLYWINLRTGIEQYVGLMDRIMTDITWAPDGKLYGADWVENKIWEINPLTAQTTLVTAIAGYDFSNAMTSDGNGNLFLVSRLAFAGNTFHVIKVNPSNGLVTVVANLTPTGLTSAGDLAFYNGLLYLACNNNILASINVNNGVINSSPIIGLPNGATIYGIVAKSDGTLYLSDIYHLYSLNITTMQANLYYTCTTPGIFIWGMANFNDYCLAPACNARVTILIESNPPYCNSPGVQLKANGTGINGAGTYKWTLPDGTTLSTQTITATKSGTYSVRYATVPDTCGWDDAVTLQIIKTPDAGLGPDKVLCTGAQLILLPSDTTDISSYLWQDGSINPQFQVTQPGLYWLQTSNICGSYRDSITVIPAAIAKVELGPLRELCLYDTLHLENLLDGPGYSYKWSNNSNGKSIIVSAAGLYWVDVTNICGTVRDSVIIAQKIDDCECSLYVPSAFTPNNDGKNDLLRTFSNCPVTGELSVYNRWGQLVFITNDLNKGWDGIYNGIPQHSAVFVYQIEYIYTFRPGRFYKKGTFVLVR